MEDVARKDSSTITDATLAGKWAVASSPESICVNRCRLRRLQASRAVLLLLQRLGWQLLFARLGNARWQQGGNAESFSAAQRGPATAVYCVDPT